MRTTLPLENDAIKVIRAYTRANRLSLGKAASELIHRGVHYQLRIRKRNGFPVFNVPEDFPVITSKHAWQILDEG